MAGSRFTFCVVSYVSRFRPQYPPLPGASCPPQLLQARPLRSALWDIKSKKISSRTLIATTFATLALRLPFAKADIAGPLETDDSHYVDARLTANPLRLRPARCPAVFSISTLTGARAGCPPVSRCAAGPSIQPEPSGFPLLTFPWSGLGQPAPRGNLGLPACRLAQLGLRVVKERTDIVLKRSKITY